MVAAEAEPTTQRAYQYIHKAYCISAEISLFLSVRAASQKD